MDDLISRKRALEEMTFSSGIEKDCVLYVPLRDVNNHLKSLPSEAYLQTIATERYEDLCEYFGDRESIILTDQKEFKKWLERVRWHVKKVDELARQLESISCSEIPNSSDGEYDPKPDIYYLAEKIGIHRLYALVVQLRGEPEPCEDVISRQTTADEIGKRAERCAERFGTDDPFWEGLMIAKNIVKCAPSVQPEIIRCKDCRYSEYDQIFHNRYCHNKGKAYLVGDDFFCAAGRYMTNGSD